MPGKATRPDDGRHNNHGTVGNKGGRPAKEIVRKQRQTRAYDDEWEVIKDFAKLAKQDLNAARNAVKELDKSING